MTESLTKKLFLSSTCYDYKSLRSQIETWASANGYEPVLSDRASFPVDPDLHRHDVCLANAKKVDLFVLLVGGRFGAPYHADASISVTWAEYRAAAESKVPMVVLVDERVWNERNEYKKDKGTRLLATSNVRTFDFVDELQADPRGRWFQIFSSPEDIVIHLQALTTLFSPAPPAGTGRVEYVDYKYVVTKSLSSEARHHLRLIYGDMERIGDYELFDLIDKIPEAAREQTEVVHELDGFTVYVEVVGPGRYIVRPTELGERVREELRSAFMVL